MVVVTFCFFFLLCSTREKCEELALHLSMTFTSLLPRPIVTMVNCMFYLRHNVRHGEERERDKDRERLREIQRKRQTERESEREKEGERKGERHRETERERQQTDSHREIIWCPDSCNFFPRPWHSVDCFHVQLMILPWKQWMRYLYM